MAMNKYASLSNLAFPLSLCRHPLTGITHGQGTVVQVQQRRPRWRLLLAIGFTQEGNVSGTKTLLYRKKYEHLQTKIALAI
ncbi:hypothetical protein YC2023_094565 [Brassica napus]